MYIYICIYIYIYVYVWADSLVTKPGVHVLNTKRAGQVCRVQRNIVLVHYHIPLMAWQNGAPNLGCSFQKVQKVKKVKKVKKPLIF